MPTAAATRGGTATIVFRVLAWALVLHIMVMAVLFGLVGLPASTVRAVAAWKEVFALVALAAVACRAAFGRGATNTPVAADLPVLALASLALLHMIASVGGWGPPTSATLLGYGVRDTMLCLGLYAVGRATPGVARDGRVLRTLLVLGALTSLVAVIERIVVTPERLVLLGVASYFNDFLGMGATTLSNDFGLPDNYWTYLGGRLVQRAGSVYLSSQGFAIPFLLIIPAATAWLVGGERRRGGWAFVAYALCWIGLLLSVTRMTMVACVLQTLAMVLLLRRPAPVVTMGLGGAFALGVLILLVPGVGWYLWDTLAWQTSSSASHAKDFATGIAALMAHPFGNGLATTDATALRMGLVPLAADNLFLKYGVELGVPAMFALAWWLATLGWMGARGALADEERPGRAAGAMLAAIALGLAMNGVTAVVTNSLPIAYLCFWLIGSIVTMLTTSTGTPQVEARPHPPG